MDWYLTKNPEKLEDKVVQYQSELPMPIGFYNSTQYRPCFYDED
jgi:hypothetical protein